MKMNQRWSIPLTVFVLCLLLTVPAAAESGFYNIGTIAGEDTQTYAGKNKGRSKESILRIITISIAVAMAILAIFFFITYLEV